MKCTFFSFFFFPPSAPSQFLSSRITVHTRRLGRTYYCPLSFQSIHQSCIPKGILIYSYLLPHFASYLGLDFWFLHSSILLRNIKPFKLFCSRKLFSFLGFQFLVRFLLPLNRDLTNSYDRGFFLYFFLFPALL